MYVKFTDGLKMNLSKVNYKRIIQASASSPSPIKEIELNTLVHSNDINIVLDYYPQDKLFFVDGRTVLFYAFPHHAPFPLQ